MVTCTETIQVGPRIFATKGKTYEVIERKRHPSALHGYVVINGDDGKPHTLPDTKFK